MKKKSELEPKKEILYLGYKINGNRIINKEEKIERTKKDIEEIEKAKGGRVMKKKLAKVLGRLQFIVPNIKEMDIYVEIYKKLEDMTGKKKFEFIKISKEEIEKLKKVEIKKDITKYDQLNLENVKEYKERGNKTPVYVDSSPWGTGIFDTKNYRMYQMKFPKSLQKLKKVSRI